MVCMYVYRRIYGGGGRLWKEKKKKIQKGEGGNCTIACVNYIAYVTDFHGNVLYQDSFIYLLHS